EDLVGVGVADPAEEPRVGERTLERVTLRDERRTKRREVRAVQLQPARVVRADPLLAPHEVDRSAPLRARLGQHEGARGEIERGEADLARWPRASRAPRRSGSSASM